MVVKSSGVETVISSGVEIVFISLHFDKAQYRLAQGDNGGIIISKELLLCHIEGNRDGLFLQCESFLHSAKIGNKSHSPLIIASFFARLHFFIFFSKDMA